MNNKILVITNNKLAGYLLFHGFELYNTSELIDSKNGIVYKFYKSEELVKAIQDFKSEKHNFSNIRSPRLAGYLVYLGFKLINITKNKFDDNGVIFWFDESEHLKEAIHNYNLIREKERNNEKKDNTNKTNIRREQINI